MSRLIVKNLPKVITEEKLKNLFSQKGTVTDIQLKYTKDGVFRQFAFIGFKTNEEAEIALTYFNNTRINTSKITVQYCTQLGAKDKPKSWSKYSSDSSAFKQKHQNNLDDKPFEKPTDHQNSMQSEIKTLLEEHKNEPLFDDFMTLHQRDKGEDWNESKATEEIEDSSHTSEEEEEGEEEESSEDEQLKKNIANKNISDLEYFKMKTISSDSKQKDEKPIIKNKTINKTKEPKIYYTVKIRGLAMKMKKKDLKEFFHPLKPKSFRFPPKRKGFAYVGFKSEKEMNQALVKNRSLLGGKRIWVTQTQLEKDNVETSNEKDTSKWKSQEENIKNEETIAESGRIFLRNLAYTCTEEEIEKLFSTFGPVTEVSLPIEKLTRKTKGFAMITFLMPEHAVIAYTKLDGTIFQGRMLHLLPGKDKHTIDELMDKDGLSYKEWKNLKSKAQSGSSHNWNSLFMGQNAVADLMAKEFESTKEKLFDARESGSLAVRIALGETQLVTRTRAFLESHGVRLDAFNQPAKQRSKNIILVKNLPALTKQEEIYNLFEKFGILGRVILPTSGVTAIVEFNEPYEARNAFTKLAYSKFKQSPLYLEWAPAETFTTECSKDKSINNNTDKEENNDNKEVEKKTESSSEKKAESSSEKKDESSSEEEDFPEPDTTLFIKGLNFSTKEEAIKEHFKKCGKIHYVNIAMKKDTKNPGHFLSMGYGFIQFKKKSSAVKALKILQHSKIEEYSIELKKSNRALINEVPSNRKVTKIGKQTCNKILVRNIPFQATEPEIKELFSPFGGLKDVRLPKKMAGTGCHRGFAFVEFYRKKEAGRAFDSLCQSTHLYGRRLVLEWAQKEENLDEIRKRSAKMLNEGPANKNFKKSVFEVEEKE